MYISRIVCTRKGLYVQENVCMYRKRIACTGECMYISRIVCTGKGLYVQE